MKKSKTVILLGLIFILALFLRVWHLDQLELFGDELDVGYQAYSLLKTGKDYRGDFLPSYIKSFSESRAPFFIYSAVPTVAVFGLNEWGVRLPSVLFGLGSILFLFWLIKLLFINTQLALITAFVLAMVPWHLHYSRTGFEVSLLIFLILGGVCFFLEGLRKRKFLFYFSALFFSLSFYTYNTANVFVPLLAITLLTIYFKEIKKNFLSLIVPGLIFLIICLPLVLKIFDGQASLRFKQISIFSDTKTIDQVILKRNAGEGLLTERIFHNKALAWGTVLIENYYTAFSPQFLFLKGDPNPRHSVPGFGVLYWFLLPFFILGLFFSLKNFKQKENQIFLAWLFVSPIASCLTVGGGSQATRLFLMLPAMVFFISVGILTVLKIKKLSLLKIFLGFLFLFYLSAYLHELFVHYPKEQYRYWHYGYKQITLDLFKNKDKCQRVYINNSNEPFLIRYLFWGKINPAWFMANFRSDNQTEVVNKYFSGFSIGEVSFGNISSSNKLEGIVELLKENNSCYIAFQMDDIPGDWNLKNNPYEGIVVESLVLTPNNQPYIYLLSGKK